MNGCYFIFSSRLYHGSGLVSGNFWQSLCVLAPFLLTDNSHPSSPPIHMLIVLIHSQAPCTLDIPGQPKANISSQAAFLMGIERWYEFNIHKMTLIQLPTKVLQLLATFLETEKDISSLSQTSTLLHTLINPWLYRYNSQNSESSALFWAVKNGNVDTARLSIEGGANVMERDIFDWTPLHWAVMEGYEAVVKLLLETGVDVNLTDSSGVTLLSLAVMQGREVIVKLLLGANGLDVNLRCSNGVSPLSLAVVEGREAIVKLLLATAKIDVNLGDSDGVTALSLAAVEDHEAILKLLLQTGDVDVNLQDSRGRTALSLAAEQGYSAVVKLLLENENVDVHLEDLEGRTPLSWATTRGHDTVARLLSGTGKLNTVSKDGRPKPQRMGKRRRGRC